MTISFPVSLPATGIKAVRWGAFDAVGVAISPFTFAQQAQEHSGKILRCTVELAAAKRADMEPWIALLISMRGRYGTCLFGDPANASPRGTATAAIVNGASQTGFTLAVDGFDGTLKSGDWIQLGTGTDSRLYKIMADATPSGAAATLDIWPRLRSSPADNDALTLASPKGKFRRASNSQEFDIGTALVYGLSFGLEEAL